MDREEERAYAAALAEVTAPGAVDLAELERAEAANESPAKTELGPVHAPPLQPASTAVAGKAKRALRFAPGGESEAEAKPGKRARFASPPPDASKPQGQRLPSPPAAKREADAEPPPASSTSDPVPSARDEPAPKRARFAQQQL